MNPPSISIVTICFNAEEDIAATMESVINQSYSNIEYIIIDGGSSDCSVKIIKRYEQLALDKKINFKWFSEKDEGIYDALNKGIDIATGEWINFMNSGDSFVDDEVLSKIIPSLADDVDVVYGDTIDKLDANNFRNSRAKTVKDLHKGSIFCHQSSFVRLSLHKDVKFDLRYKICADFNFFYSMHVKGKSFKYVPEFISLYDLNGISSTSYSYIIEMQDIVSKINGGDLRLGYFLYLKSLYKLKSFIKMFLSPEIVIKIKMKRG